MMMRQTRDTYWRYFYAVRGVELQGLFSAEAVLNSRILITTMACRVYAGVRGLDPDARFDVHEAGIQANRFVKEFGLRLLPELYEVYNPMPYDGACETEAEIAIWLREAGYGVWQA